MQWALPLSLNELLCKQNSSRVYLHLHKRRHFYTLWLHVLMCMFVCAANLITVYLFVLEYFSALADLQHGRRKWFDVSNECWHNPRTVSSVMWEDLTRLSLFFQCEQRKRVLGWQDCCAFSLWQRHDLQPVIICKGLFGALITLHWWHLY